MSVATEVARAAQLLIDQANTAAKLLMTPIFNVQGYGAKGVDAAVDTQAFHDAVADAKAAGGGLVYFPAGTWLLQNAVADGEGIVIAGAGATATIIKVVNTTGYGLTLGNGTTKRFHCTVRDLAFVHVGIPTAGALLRLWNVGQSQLHSVKFMNWNPGWTALYSKDSSQVQITNFEVQACLSDGIVLEDCGDHWFTTGRVDGCGGHAIFVRSSQGLAFENVGGYQNGGSTYYFDSTGVPSVWCRFTDCGGDTGGNHNWVLQNCEGFQLLNCWAGTHMDTAPAYACGFVVTATAKDINFTGCKAISNNTDGWFIDGGKDIRIVGCTARRNGVKGGVGNTAGLRINNGDRITISGCDFYEDYVTPTQAYGIILHGTTNRYVLTGCNLTGNVTGGLFNDATGLTFVVANNLV